jgi:predicted TIM-barrel fold metal-dependent hydrolase
MLTPDMQSFRDPEGAKIPEELSAVVDCHVHLFPRNLFRAVWKWFDQYAWKIRYRMPSSEVLDYLLSRGVRHVVALQYAHKPGISKYLNRYMTEKCEKYKGRVTGLATVFPGEEGAVSIVREAFESGLEGLKLHAHVQCFDVADKSLYRLYECCRSYGKPVVMHIGREPKSDAYACDPYQLCRADRLAPVLKDFPDLKIVVPHLGFDETSAYRRMAEAHDNLWLDTTMVITNYFPMKQPVDLAQYRPDRMLYGSDFPNIPYAWDRELAALVRAGLSPEFLEKITWKNAADLFGLDIAPSPGH